MNHDLALSLESSLSGTLNTDLGADRIQQSKTNGEKFQLVTKSVSKPLPINTKPRRHGSAQMASLKNSTASCTGWVGAEELLAWGNHHSSFLLSPGTEQTNFSGADARLLHPLQKAIFSTCCSPTRPEHRITKAKAQPGLDSNPGKGILALWLQSRLQAQPSSTQGQCFESSASEGALHLLFPSLEAKRPPRLAGSSPSSEQPDSSVCSALPAGHTGTCGSWHGQPPKTSPPLQINSSRGRKSTAEQSRL